MKYIVYRHIRLDTNEVFYVGICKTNNKRRVNSIHSRNYWWTNIVNKHGFKSEILYKDLKPNDAAELEEFLISIYGRKDKNNGTLVNMTNGGDGIREFKPSKLQNYNHSERMKGVNNPNYNKEMPQVQKDKLSKSMKGKLSKGNNPNARIVLDLNTGIFYDCLKDACYYLNYKYNTIKSQFQRKINKEKCNLVYC